MAGERQLAPGREDADARVAALLRGQRKHGLREVQLAREPLHRRLADGAGVGEDREGVALERGIGEDVGDHVVGRMVTALPSPLNRPGAQAGDDRLQAVAEA